MTMKSATRTDWWSWRCCSHNMKIRTIKQIKNLKNKRVLLRVDFNVPMKNSKIIDDSRIKSSIPTIEYLLKKKAKVILVSHLGRPEGYDKKLSLEPVAKRASELLNKKVEFLKIKRLEDYFRKDVGAYGNTPVLLENIRFFNGDKDGVGTGPDLSRQLANLADIFVLDGFAVAHRAAASVSGVAKYLPSYAGLLLEKEIAGLSKATQKPKKPYVVVLGGVKMETKLPVLKNLLPKADYVLVGGGLASTYFWAKGYKVGQSLIDKEYKKEALALLKNKKVVLPVDVVVGDENGKRARVVAAGAGLKPALTAAGAGLKPATEAIYDIGPETIRLYAKYIKKAQTIVWNGAMGYFEQKPYDTGTLSIARLVASRSKGQAFGIIGGGETLQAMEMTKMGEYLDLISTGGGALLEFLAGVKLPGLKALTK